MANVIENDKGEIVWALGAENSLMRALVQHPMLIETVKNELLASEGRRPDIEIELIRQNGIGDPDLTDRIRECAKQVALGKFSVDEPLESGSPACVGMPLFEAIKCIDRNSKV